VNESYEPQLQPNTVISDRYTIVEHLASGGMAEVYVAIQAPLGRKVALKVLHSDQALDESMVKRFYREAVSVSQLTHPNTITVHDFGQTPDGKLYFVMELLDGEPLGARIQREGTIPVDDAIEIAIQVARSLHEAHQNGLVHRDLKPDNIFLGRVERNLVKVLDFGIAAHVASEKLTKLTQAGTIPGTPEYMSPEQARGDELDARSDLYSLGIVLYEMLTGDVPFTGTTPLGTTPLAVIIKHLNETPRRLPASLGRPLVEFVAQLLHKTPSRRPRDAREFIEKLRDVAAKIGEGGAASQRVRSRPSSRPSQPSAGPSQQKKRRGPPSPAELAAQRTRIMTQADKENRPPMQSAKPADPETAPTVVDNKLPLPDEFSPGVVESAEPAAKLDGIPAPSRGQQMPQAPPRSGGRTEKPRRRVTLPSGQQGVVDTPTPTRRRGAPRGKQTPRELFLEFAEPTVAVLGKRPSAEDLQNNLAFAQMAWNAVVEGAQTVAAVREHLEGKVSPRMLEVFEILVQRKLRGYRGETWRVAVIRVEEGRGGKPNITIGVRE